ncbi:MAG TPA: hypothetical protein VMG62_01095 [Solirubrobacteraceae bacterium]|nr:hypothetical protein [Solirubrobacteraceae bacterium]
MRATHLLTSRLRERHSPRRRRRASLESVPSPSAPTRSDPAVERVRSAGGPIDNASYSCSCGLVFAARVSTTVCCPRCGADQAW